jgi:alginate O-acetyltransferase complex protein AlgI
MTLSRFLRDYLYIPMGGSRRGPVRRYVNIMVTMLLGGLWHGASWNFVAWGAIHGIGLMVNHLAQGVRWFKPHPLRSWCATLAFVMFAWVPFRAETAHSTIVIWRSMLGLTGVMPRDLLVASRPFALTTAAVAFGAALYLPNTAEIMARLERYAMPVVAAGAGLVFGATLGAIVIHPPTEFLYFRF